MKKKSIIKEILLIAFTGVVGGVIAFLIGRIDLSAVADSVYSIAAIVVPLLFVLINAVSALIAEFRLRKAKKQYENYNAENEDELTEIENSLGSPLLFLTVTAILNLAFLSVIIELTDYTKIYGEYVAVVIIATIAITIISTLLHFVIARKYVELVKEINPEKKGDILDRNFDKKWEESCDEGEKLIMYKSAYASFKATNICCSVLWFVCLFLQLCFGTGILPVLCVSAVWLTMTISYCLESNKHSK